MLLAQQPAHVREEESSACIVRIGVRICEFVVHTMVSSPLNDWVLEGDWLEDYQNKFQLSVGFVRPMSPETMCAGGDTEASE